MFNEKAVTQIVLINLVGEICVTVKICFSGGRLYAEFSVHSLYVWIIQGVNVNGYTKAMLGDLCAV